MGTKLQFNNAYHPQIDGKTEVVNQSLGNMLRSIVGEKPKQWDLNLPQAEFSYNSLVNGSIGKYSFQVVYGISGCLWYKSYGCPRFDASTTWG